MPGPGRSWSLVAASLVAALAGCSSTKSPPKVVSIEVGPADVLVATGFPRQLGATAHLSDGTVRDVTATASWQSSAPTVISVSTTGLASFVAVGGAAITATDPGSSVAGTLAIPARHVAFVTSSTGAGNFAAWPGYTGAATGADAADAVCQARAQAAGLPGTFRAWLSDTGDDAYCRLQGLSGKKAASCGQATLPSAGGPWVRMDGHPFAPALATLATGVLYTGVLFDETATPLPEGSFYWDVTDPAGVLSWPYAACSDWTAADTTQSCGGSAFGVDFTWTYIIAPTCDVPLHLLCLQAGGGPPLPAGLVNPPGAKRAFITSTVGTGDLGSWAGAGGATGLAAGDAICAARAAAAGLPGTFRAWLSDGTANAIDRLSSNGPWVRVDGAAVAANKAGLTSGRLLTNLVVTESGTYLVTLGGGGQSQAWTGTLAGGTVSAHHCSGWTSALSTDTGREGDTSSLLPRWTENGEWACDGYWLHLYCFED